MIVQATVKGIDRPTDVVRQTRAVQAPRSYRSVLSGLQARRALISHDGNQEGVAIGLTPRVRDVR